MIIFSPFIVETSQSDLWIFFIEKTEIESLSLSMQSDDGVLAQKRSKVRTREVRLAKVLVNRQTELLICID